jgi:hypothetical protein
MKALKYAAIVLLADLIIAPCLLIFNEQPDSEPQNWWVNLLGFAYTGALILVYRRYEKRKSQKS